MRRHWKYLKYVLRHKWFVFLACWELGVPLWMAIVHDWDKFLPGMWRAYADYFYGNLPAEKDAHLGALAGVGIFPKTKEDARRDMEREWNGHQKRNKHHWQYWLLVNDARNQRFWEQSMDGGMTHSYLKLKRGDYEFANIAVVYEYESMDWWKPDLKALDEMKTVLSFEPVVLPMPDVYIREMVADWRGAGRALGKPDTIGWYKQNAKNMLLHPDTRSRVEEILGVKDA